MARRDWFMRLVLAAIAGFAAAMGGPVLAQDAGPMASTIAEVKAKWPGLNHVTPEQVQTLIDGGKAVMFDVRTPEEYAVSRIPGAVRVDPAMSREAFIAAHGAAVKGKTPVFYCAAGVRSSKLTERIGPEALAAAGAASAPVSMAGGIFQWNWESRPLAGDKGATDAVHGYDAKWGRLVKQR